MLPRKNRVLTAAEFRQGFKSPVRISTDWASFYLVSLGEAEPTRIGFVVSGSIGNAVVRNRVKRKLREASRGFLETHETGIQLTLRVRPEVVAMDFDSIQAQFLANAERLVGKALGVK